jgi:hypothetical protein
MPKELVPTTRIGRIAAIVDRELAKIEMDLARVDAEPAPLGRLELLARLIRQLELTDDRPKTDNPYEGLPAPLLREVLKHIDAKKTG